ncbi:MAG: phosphoribosylformylglycinamidine cyclo-ligase [Candidatus Eremiobacteraeota bacterium]|nr:phosphoribosylformylglycinamidine cyclo-ligase [Candidatus Eremiobacteraeota bacterium]
MSDSNAYARAGVDISAGNATVARYRDVLAAWRHPAQVGGIGGFSGLFRLPGDERRLLVGSTDGVGTKILIAAQARRYDTVGADLVNHCVNDILVVNAKPLFFLDYLAVGKLEPEIAAAIVGGVARACAAHDCALLGGETAEMPGLYAPEHFDLAGTIVGIVDAGAVPDLSRVTPGDAIVGLPAVGLHTNGYSLARALIGEEEWERLVPLDGRSTTYLDALLAGHPSYARDVQAIEAVAEVKAMAHITGGGLLDNVARTLPQGCKAVFEQTRWPVPALLKELITRGNLSHEERYRTLNMGLGYTLIVPMMAAAKAKDAVAGATIAGWIEIRKPGEPAVVIHPARS